LKRSLVTNILYVDPCGIVVLESDFQGESTSSSLELLSKYFYSAMLQAPSASAST